MKIFYIFLLNFVLFNTSFSYVLSTQYNSLLICCKNERSLKNLLSIGVEYNSFYFKTESKLYNATICKFVIRIKRYSNCYKLCHSYHNKNMRIFKIMTNNNHYF